MKHFAFSRFRVGVRPCRPPFWHSGFTLIEILSGVAIMAILMAFLLPTLSSMGDGAKGSKNVSNLRQIGNLFALHAQENSGRLPEGDPAGGGQDQWFMALMPYGDTRVGFNGNDVVRIDNGAHVNDWRNEIAWKIYDSPFVTPRQRQGWPRYPDYKMNMWSNYDGTKWTPLIPSRLKSATRHVLLAENDGSQWNVGPVQAMPSDYTPTARSRGKVGVLWADYHVSLTPQKELAENATWKEIWLTHEDN